MYCMTIAYFVIYNVIFIIITVLNENGIIFEEKKQ